MNLKPGTKVLLHDIDYVEKNELRTSLTAEEMLKYFGTWVTVYSESNFNPNNFWIEEDDAIYGYAKEWIRKIKRNRR